VSGQFIPLEQTCDFLSGYAWSAANFDADPVGLPIIRIQNVDAVRDSDFVYWPGEYDERFVVRAGDLLLTLSGSFRAVVWQGPDALLNQRIVRLTPKPGYSLDWLLHVLRNGLNTISGLGRHALVSNVALADLRQLKVPFHTSEEQRRIAAILDQAETLRSQRRQALAHLDTLTQSLFLDMFGDPVENKNDIAVCQLQALCNRITDGTHQSPDWVEDGIPFLFISNIVDGTIIFDTHKFISEATYLELTKRCPIEIGDVLYTTVGSYGNAAVVTDSKRFAFQRHIAHIKPDRSKADALFLAAMLQSMGVRRQVDKVAKGVAQKTVNLADLKGLTVFAPPIPLQQTFATRIQAIEALKATYRTALAQLDALFASLQQRAFAGEL
jgi:type I restriction enzyme S subunit